MPLVMLGGLFAMLTVAITYVGYRYYARPGRYYEHLGEAAASGADDSHLSPYPKGTVVRLVQSVGAKVPVSPDEVAITRRFLVAAGYRSDAAVQVYYGIKCLAAAALLLLAYTFRDYLPFTGLLRGVLVATAGGTGWALPGLVLERIVSARQEALKFALPDALDLMMVCVEAGLALDQAILRVSEELQITHKELADEFGLVTLEMQAGKSRAEALRNLAERTGEPEIRKFIAILIQTDRFGTSMSESLRTHSDFLRVRRRQEAEERANKVGVKLVFPIFFCILPAMLIVVAGPGILQIIKQLFPMMRQFSQMKT